MKKTYIAPSIKVKEMESTGELLAGSYETSVHTEGTLPQGIKNDADLADKSWSKENNSIWDSNE
jgi:hypothetical protein